MSALVAYFYRMRRPLVMGLAEHLKTPPKSPKLQVLIDYGDEEAVGIPSDIITQNVSVPEDMRAVARALRDPLAPPEAVKRALSNLVAMVAPLDRELARAACVKVGDGTGGRASNCTPLPRRQTDLRVMLAGPKVGERREKVGNWSQGEKRGRGAM
eukprot:6148549-Pyramimonas_sp.AAC.1